MVLSTKRGVQWFVAIGLFLAGCSDSDSNGGTGGNGSGGSAGSGQTFATLADAEEAYIDAVCEKINKCYPTTLLVAYGTVEECKSRGRLASIYADELDGSTVTPEQIGDCMGAVNDASCEEVFSTTPTACQIKGSLKDGTPCAADLQCESGQCDTSGSGDCGVCKSRNPKGSSCESSIDCDYGLDCSTSGVCVEQPKAGDSCETVSCQGPLVCTGADGAKTCANSPAAGEACDPNSITAPKCSPYLGLICSSSGVCAKFGFADVGQPCGSVNGGYVLCSGGDCVVPSGKTQGTCAAKIADGASCGGDIPGECETPADCVNGKCTIFNPSTCN